MSHVLSRASLLSVFVTLSGLVLVGCAAEDGSSPGGGEASTSDTAPETDEDAATDDDASAGSLDVPGEPDAGPSDPVAADLCAEVTCGDDASCQAGSCYCDDGFTEDAEGVCVPTDACWFVTCGDHSACVDGACVCHAGFQDDGEGTCQDIDECLMDNGGCGDATYYDCTNSLGSSSCADVDECLVDNGGCGDNAQCTNQEGDEPLCTCSPGFLYDASGACVPTPACLFVVCADNSHCEEGECLCDGGFTPDAEGDCADIDECLVDNGGCGDPVYYACMNTEGGHACADIDECLADNGGCGEHAVCANQDGAEPICACNDGYTLLDGACVQVGCVLPGDWAEKAFAGCENLENADLEGANLQGLDLPYANLTGANLKGADLTDANLAYAVLTDVSSGDILGTPLALPADWMLAKGYLLGPGAHLAEADLSYGELASAALQGANLVEAKLEGANLEDADLTAALLSGANLKGANLEDTNLEGSEFNEVDLEGAVLIGANLHDANLEGTLWAWSFCPDGHYNDGDTGEETCCGHLLPGHVAKQGCP